MDIRAYFEKLRKIERSITAEEVVIISLATSDGGKEGVASEVNRLCAARLITEGRARLASTDEITEFRSATEHAIQKAEHSRLAQRVQVAVITDQDLRSLKASRVKG